MADSYPFPIPGEELELQKDGEPFCDIKVISRIKPVMMIEVEVQGDTGLMVVDRERNWWWVRLPECLLDEEEKEPWQK